MERLFLHVGYPKTGTSSLQSALFADHSQICDLRTQFPGIQKLRRAVCSDPMLDTRSIRRKVGSWVSSRPEHVGVYSEESFTNNYEIMGDDSITRKVIAKRLHDIFANSHVSTEVVVVIRRQQDILISAFTFWYYTYQKMGYSDLNEMIRMSTQKSKSKAHLVLSWFKYFETINEYRKRFGYDNVHVLMYESMDKEMKEFIRCISDILGINAKQSINLMNNSPDRNVTKTTEGYRVPSKMYHWVSVLKSRYLPNARSFRNFAVGRWLIDWLRGDGSEVSLSQESCHRLQNLYGEDNRKIEEKFGVPLGENGYYVM